MKRPVKRDLAGPCLTSELIFNCELFIKFPLPQAWNNFVNSSEEDQQRILQMRKSAAPLTSIQEEESDEGEDENGNLDDSWEEVCASSCDKRTGKFSNIMYFTLLW